MRVRMLKAAKAYWNYAVTDFPAGEEFDGDLACHLAANTEPGTVEVLEADPEPEPEVAEEPEEDPESEDGDPEPDGDLFPIDGTAAEVLAWVGDDLERAAVALEVERERDKPRSTLVKQLEKLAES
jgi:hypothetical protein